MVSDEIKWEFFPAVAVSVQLYGCTTSPEMKHLEKKLMRTTQECKTAVPSKTAFAQPLTSHLTNHPSKMG